MLNFRQFRVLMFDCYGTLIDWESGIVRSVRPILEGREVQFTDSEILDLYAQLESEAEGKSYSSYKSILHEVMEGFGQEYGFQPTDEEKEALALAVPKWKPFNDTVPALKELRRRYKLAILSNIDNDLIEHSVSRLKVKFDWVITAEEVKSYKPSYNNFKAAFKQIGYPKHKILHIAQSLFHDIVPAKALGMKTVWVNRRRNIEGFGATPPAHATADLEVLDLRSLAALSRPPQKPK